MDKQELNEVCKQIEMAIRTHSENPKRRFGSIRAELIREAMIKYRIGLVCESCLLDPKARAPEYMHIIAARITAAITNR